MHDTRIDTLYVRSNSDMDVTAQCRANPVSVSTLWDSDTQTSPHTTHGTQISYKLSHDMHPDWPIKLHIQTSSVQSTTQRVSLAYPHSLSPLGPGPPRICLKANQSGELTEGTNLLRTQGDSRISPLPPEPSSPTYVFLGSY